MVLKDKTILIISPQKWCDDMHVSKHHYAIELSKRNNKIYFLPTSSNLTIDTIEIEQVSTFKNINIIHHKKFIGEILRFHLRVIYKILLKKKLKSILKKIDPIDLILSFDNTATYPDLSIFKTKKRIFFPVDQINLNHLSEYKNFGNIIFSISPVILNSFINTNAKKILLNHGLGSDWVSMAQNKLNLISNKSYSNPFHVGYFGNLVIGKSLDMNTLKNVIKSHPEIEFHFWGNYNLNDTSDEEVVQWIHFLKNTNNVSLYGPISPYKLVKQVDKIDAFML